jgi:hypothetical protein
MYQTDCKQNHDNKIVLYQYSCLKHIEILLEICTSSVPRLLSQHNPQTHLTSSSSLSLPGAPFQQRLNLIQFFSQGCAFFSAMANKLQSFNQLAYPIWDQQHLIQQWRQEMHLQYLVFPSDRRESRQPDCSASILMLKTHMNIVGNAFGIDL